MLNQLNELNGRPASIPAVSSAELEMSEALWVVGDIHGALGKLKLLLLRSGLSDFDGSWRGGGAHLVFLGDYLDRGEDGAGVIRLIRTLQRQATLAGGRVDALLGNHEVMFLAALLFRQKDPRDELGFYEYWHSNGGQPRDMALIEPGDLGWMIERPAMLRVGPWILQHADNAMYLKLTARDVPITVDSVNAAIKEKLVGNDPRIWQELMNTFAARFAFAGPDGGRLIKEALTTFGAERIVHGHTPINLLLGTAGEEPGAPLLYAGRLCIDIDSAMAYIPGAGFITRLDAGGIAEVVTYPPMSYAR